MNPRIVPLIAVLVAITLVASVAHPAALTEPYTERTPSYAVAHESTEAFDEITEHEDVDADDPTPVSDLSSETQRAFDEAIERPPDRGDEYRAAGWRQHDGVTLCDDAVYVCDEYAELPAFPDDGNAGETYATYGVVEHDEELYVVETESGASLGFPVELVFKSVVFLPYALFLGFAASSRSAISLEKTATLAGYGVALVVAAFAYPYLVMYGVVGSGWPIVLVAGGTWAVMAAGGYGHYRKRVSPSP